MPKFLDKREPFEKKIVKEEYKPLMDYSILKVELEEEKKLIECEKVLSFHTEKTTEHLLSISETLVNAQKVLSNHSGGTFKKWFEGLGLKKDFVYTCIKKHELYIQYKKENIMNLPERVIREITKKEQEYNELNIIEIIDSKKPTQKLKEIKKELSDCTTTKKENKDSKEKKLEKIELEISRLEEKIKKLLVEKEKLK